MFDVDTLELYKKKGLISRQKHPSAPYWIHNYTQKCAFERAWDEVTIACRGLILDEKCDVIARPFPKFFNLEDHSRSDIVFSKPFTIHEKMDGSLGILYRLPWVQGQKDQWAIATRGSFSSDQALHATKVFNDRYRSGANPFEPPIHATMLFEIVYPSNRIVVDYGELDDLVLLTVIDNYTGRDVSEFMWTGPRAKKFNVTNKTTKIKPREVLELLDLKDDGNNEGVVLCFEWPKEGPKTRVKVKLDEYKRLHRILTMVSTKSIWEILAYGGDIMEVVDRVPDEFFDWVQDTVSDLQGQFAALSDEVDKATFAAVQEMVGGEIASIEAYREFVNRDRKAFAEIVMKNRELADLIFWRFDGKDLSDKIWRRLRPEYAKPFARDIDS